jgi:hypothetical protein
MTQRLVLELLKELGGSATTKDILNFAKLKYPDSGFDNRGIAHKLTRLQIWGNIQHDRINGLWSIIDK